MRRIPALLLPALLLLSVGCMHQGKDNSAAKSAALGDSDRDLASDVGSRPVATDDCSALERTACTLEYNPQVCTYAGETLKEGNPCGATRSARLIACRNKVAFKADELKCQSANQIAEKLCPERTVCTREFHRTVCAATAGEDKKNLEAVGSNKCESLNNLVELYCKEGVILDRSAAICKDAPQ